MVYTPLILIRKLAKVKSTLNTSFDSTAQAYRHPGGVALHYRVSVYRVSPPGPNLTPALAAPVRPARTRKRRQNVRLGARYTPICASTGTARCRARYREKGVFGQVEPWQRANFMEKPGHFSNQVVREIKNRHNLPRTRATKAYPIPF